MEDESTRIVPKTGPLPTREPSAPSAVPAPLDTLPGGPVLTHTVVDLDPTGPLIDEPDTRPRVDAVAPPRPPVASAVPAVMPTVMPAAVPAATPAVPETPPGTASAAIPEVRLVGRYRIHERLGRGGMATVFRAADPDIGRDLAIKFLHASLCADDEYRARFLQEARAAGGLSHPNIVTVHDVGEIEGRPYMAMELLDGESLGEIMAGGKPLPVRDVVIMGIQLARALDYAHSRGIVHRDIKPGNIMRLRNSQTVKVTDFGIAHVESTGKEQRTRVGDVLGTPQYMSPEQAAGEKLDGRSDLFSSGIMFYQMLTGQRPFQGDSLVALAMKIAKDDPPPIEKLRPDLPASMRRVVERCLAKAPDRRFQTGKELSDALSRVLTELDDAVREKDKPSIVPLRVKWAAMMALIVAGVMAVAGTVITQRQYAAMFNQVVGNGAALSRFIAKSNAAAALGEDWIAVDVSVQEIMRTGDFSSITVVDRGGVVRASSEADQAGKPYVAPAGETVNKGSAGSVTRYELNGETVLGFEAPITFQNKQVGRVALGLPERPLAQVARLSITLMLMLVVITVLAVAVAMYFVANWFAKPIELLGHSMGEIAKGRFDYRIREQRKDEFGQLYLAFDAMAQALHDRSLGASPPTSTHTPTGLRLNSPETAPPSPPASPRPPVAGDTLPGGSPAPSDVPGAPR